MRVAAVAPKITRSPSRLSLPAMRLQLTVVLTLPSGSGFEPGSRRVEGVDAADRDDPPPAANGESLPVAAPVPGAAFANPAAGHLMPLPFVQRP